MTDVGGDYRTIKALVLDFVHASGGNVDYASLTERVRSRFPASKWQKTHWAWYRHQILHGRFKNQFSEQERTALSQGARPIAAPAAPITGGDESSADVVKQMRQVDPETKRVGDAILNHVRFVISLAAGNDITKQFKLKRWVFSRLLGEENRVKRPIKKQLWAQGMRTCQACQQQFPSLKGVEIHRKDGAQGYSAANCELLCRECHQELG